MNLPNFTDNFCLKPGRDSFSVDPTKDNGFLFGPPDWHQQIQHTFQRAILLNKPLRIIWWGDYGIGKTHRINHAVRYIEAETLPFLPVRVDCSDIQDKSGFERLHFPMVNNLGVTEVQPIAEQFVIKMKNGHPSFADWSDVATSEDVISAVKMLGNPNEDNWRAAWKWMTGLPLEKVEPALAKVTKKQIDSSIEYAEVLRALSLMIMSERHQRLVYFVDQVERLTKITNANAQNTWVETIRAVLDTAQIGVVLAVGASRLDQLPAVVLAPEVASRFGKEALEKFHLKHYTPQDAATFLEQLFSAWVDAPKRDALAAAQGWSAGQYDPKFYPFTPGAFAIFCKNVTHDPRDAKPRAFLEKLDFVAAEACMQGHRVIDKPVLYGLGYSD